ncbi:hypothetical protein BELL_0981g00030 [Botrytis elliptica]|uniref:Uncharacterized protein n=1 Tax=Botrytis elliptica TaxID=278938 RepID=A0A4Z1IXE0_9HELO|nr:hypothetical protein BELL_0981g00030 [Botrytis elliptica]
MLSSRTQNSMISFADRELSGLVDCNTGEDLSVKPNTITTSPLNLNPTPQRRHATASIPSLSSSQTTTPSQVTDVMAKLETES